MERFEIISHKGPKDDQVPVVVLRRQGPPFVELKDLLFDAGSAVPLLGAGPPLREFHTIDILVAALVYGHRNPERVCMIYGHADAAGEEADNQELSRKRAVAVKALLLGEENNFLIVSSETPILTVQKTLASLDAGMGMHCHPGKIDGVDGPKTAAAIRRFRSGYNELFEAYLSDTPRFDRACWKAFFHIVQDQIREALAQLNLDRTQLKFRLATQSGGIVACGERRPIQARDRNNFKSQKNRRVELVFYREADVPQEESKTHFKPVPFEPTAIPMFDIKGVTLACGHDRSYDAKKEANDSGKKPRTRRCSPGGTLEVVCPPFNSDSIVARTEDSKKVLLKWELDGQNRKTHVGTSFQYDVPGLRNPANWIPEIEDLGWMLRGEWGKIKGCEPQHYSLVGTSPLGQQFPFKVIAYPNLTAKCKIDLGTALKDVKEFWKHLQEAADFLIDAPKVEFEFLKGVIAFEGGFKEHDNSPQVYYQFKVEGGFAPFVGASVNIPIILPDKVVPKFARKWMYEIDPRFTLSGALDLTIRFLRNEPESTQAEGELKGSIGVGVSLKLKIFKEKVLDAKFEAKSRITAMGKIYLQEQLPLMDRKIEWTGLAAQFSLTVFSGKFEMGSELVTLVRPKTLCEIKRRSLIP